MYGIPSDELVIQQYEALRADGWLDPQEVIVIKESWAADRLLSTKYRESVAYYVEKLGISENSLRSAQLRINELERAQFVGKNAR